MRGDERQARVREVRRRLAQSGPPWTREHERDFETVTLPERDCDLLRDLLISDRVETVVEVGLAYGSSALAIGEALVTIDPPHPRHIIVDPFQQRAYANVGWDLLRTAGLDSTARLMCAWSSIALPALVTDGLIADAAFVDGSHRFHEVFVDLYFLRKIVRPGGLIVMDDDWTPSVRTAVRYYERNLGWAAIPDAFTGGTLRNIGDDPAAELVPRCRAIRLPESMAEPPFEQFHPS
ncbi:class I SAM-dependent methyltransferase [Verrucosispora sp. WMMC514]|uniref:class I SAM-dependent methyltransferase n=1 Tax=Verrucosispora sp. WMMC514 TaxID=3015156 RepID=UPI00248C9ED5|nr:class I SAM-dependent methyltransferase [Verrucosispora sp. WMMC514]WBB94328.1 class I SAM-dependent methyltransferase [Verrucosispora sp. WMMC514]